MRQDDREIKEALSNAIESFCTIDDKKIIFKATQANLGLDAGLIHECIMMLKQSKIIYANFQNKKTVDVFDLEHRHYAKLIQTSAESLVVIGGQTKAFNQGNS